MYADVLVELKTKKIDKTFTYIIPDNINSNLIGKRVLVPFGRQKLFLSKKRKFESFIE